MKEFQGTLKGCQSNPEREAYFSFLIHRVLSYISDRKTTRWLRDQYKDTEN